MISSLINNLFSSATAKKAARTSTMAAPSAPFQSEPAIEDIQQKNVRFADEPEDISGGEAERTSLAPFSTIDLKRTVPVSQFADALSSCSSNLKLQQLPADENSSVLDTPHAPRTPYPSSSHCVARPGPVALEIRHKKRSAARPLGFSLNLAKELDDEAVLYSKKSKSQSPMEQEEKTFVELRSMSVVRPPSPRSPARFDDIQYMSRQARSWSLTRPEDFSDLSPEQRRLPEFRVNPDTLWMRTLNNAVVERDYKRATELLKQPDHPFRGDDAHQLDKLARCCTVLHDWKTLAVILCYSKGRNIEEEREVLDAMRDVVSYGLSNLSATALPQQQICMHLVMCSYGGRFSRQGASLSRLLTMDDLVGFCRSDDVVALAAASLQFLERAVVTDLAGFCNLETPIKVSPSRLTEDRLQDEEAQEDHAITIADSYFTPDGKNQRNCCSSDECDFDVRLSNLYSQVLVPAALNGRNATVLEFAAMVIAPHCVTFMCELASGRLT